MPNNDPKVQAALETAERILRESIKMQEKAADRILDLAERVQANTHNRAIALQAEAIMEACGFQDLSCQRLNKVAKLIKHLQNADAGLSMAQEAEKEEKQAFETGGGLTQEQIDALMNNQDVKNVL